MADSKQKNNLNDEKVEKTIASGRHGCSHYARKCKFISPCCKKEYPCRVCHDEAEDHEIDRKSVQEVKCLFCHHQQKVSESCEKCRTVFGKYFCSICRLYDDTDKGQFHCDGCGLCRIGGKDKFFHCDKCGMCLVVSLQGNHKCVEESSRRNCAICLEDLHTSRTDSHIPPCGHLIHRMCFQECVKSGNYACPTCAQSLVPMENIWSQLDEEVAQTPMPQEYRNFRVYILCRDCHKESKVLFHVIGLKCALCGSYNTCRAADPDGEPDTPVGGDPAEVTGSSGVTGSSEVTNTDTEGEISDHGRVNSENVEQSNDSEHEHDDGAVGGASILVGGTNTLEGGANTLEGGAYSSVGGAQSLESGEGDGPNIDNNGIVEPEGSDKVAKTSTV